MDCSLLSLIGTGMFHNLLNHDVYFYTKAVSMFENDERHKVDDQTKDQENFFGSDSVELVRKL